MDGEIVLDRGDGAVRLNDSERALMQEIEIEAPRPVHRAPRPTPRAPPRASGGNREDVEMDAFINPTKQQHHAPPDAPEFDHGDGAEDYFDDDFSDDDYGDDDGMGGGGPPPEQPSAGYGSIDDEKADLINKLNRLEKKGFTVNKRLNVYSQVDDIRAEYKRISYSIEVEQSIKFSRRMLIACTTGLEFMNKKFNPFELELDGWSENVMENVDDYDGVFEELYIKYRSSMQVAPEVKLIMMLGGSAMMFHLTNSMFKTAIPNMSDVVKQNPALVQDMVAAVQRTQQQAQAPTTTSGSGDSTATGTGGGYEMKGPGIDLSSLMGTISMPPQTMSTTPDGPRPPPEDVADDISDIVEQVTTTEDTADESEVKEVDVSATTKKKKAPKKKKTEISL